MEAAERICYAPTLCDRGGIRQEFCRVTTFGWIADQLRDGELLALIALLGRYADIQSSKAYVASITLKSIKRLNLI